MPQIELKIKRALFMLGREWHPTSPRLRRAGPTSLKLWRTGGMAGNSKKMIKARLPSTSLRAGRPAVNSRCQIIDFKL